MTNALQHHDQPVWHPSYWLAALGAGGLAVSFFMYLMWLLPHPHTPMPTWVDLQAAGRFDPSLPTGVAPIALIATLVMVLLAALHFGLVIWNLRAQQQAKRMGQYQAFYQSASELQLLAQPLTLTMSVNVAFALGAVLVPGLWQIVEWLFPLAMIAFLGLGVWILKSYGSYLSRMLVQGGYKDKEHNHLSALIAVFSMSMVSVGFTAPAAMSNISLTAAIAGTLSLLFFVVAVAVAVLVLFAGVQSMLRHGLQPKATPSIWMLVPIMTLLGIEWVRMQHGLDHHFAMSLAPGWPWW